jgi:hypothetical protein
LLATVAVSIGLVIVGGATPASARTPPCTRDGCTDLDPYATGCVNDAVLVDTALLLA